MQKLLLATFFLFGCLFAQAQTDSTLTQYTGKYTFTDGSPVKEISVAVEDGKLMATSAMGNSALNKTDVKDVFEVAAYGGTATFKRNDEGKITGVTVQVQDMTMEGTKGEASYNLMPLPNLSRFVLLQ
jgi:Domain of unknown function (DUF3471)